MEMQNRCLKMRNEHSFQFNLINLCIMNRQYTNQWRLSIFYSKFYWIFMSCESLIHICYTHPSYSGQFNFIFLILMISTRNYNTTCWYNLKKTKKKQKNITHTHYQTVMSPKKTMNRKHSMALGTCSTFVERKMQKNEKKFCPSNKYNIPSTLACLPSYRPSLSSKLPSFPHSSLSSCIPSYLPLFELSL